MGTLRFILGRAGTGKTRFCVDSIARELHRSPLEGPAVVLLVPEQATFQMSRMLANWRNLHGYVRGRVMSFKSLAQSTVGALSGGKRPLLGFSRKLVMQQIIAAMQGELKFWNTTRPERIAGPLLTLLDELTQAELDPSQLQAIGETLHGQGQMAAQFADKLADIIKLEKQYRKMDLAGFDDPLVYLDQYRQVIGQVQWLKGARLCVDGFAGFAGQELAALVATIAAAEHTHITLSLDPDLLGKPQPEELQNFWPSVQTYERLTDLTKKSGIRLLDPVVLDHSRRRRYRNSETLWRLEGYLAGKEEKNTQFSILNAQCSKKDIAIISAEDPGHEVELAGGKILQLVRENGYRFRDISIIVRELNSYEHLIRYLFEQYKIPYFLDIRRPIAHHPLTRLVLSAVGALTTGFDTRWMLRYLKSGMTDVPTEAADRLENYVLAHGIDGRRWLTEWHFRGGLLGPEDREDKPERSECWDLAAVNRHREQLVGPLRKLAGYIGIREGVEQAFSIAMFIDGLVRFLQDLRVTEKLNRLQNESDRETKDTPRANNQNAQIHRQIWDVLIELMQQLRVTLSGRDLDLNAFLSVLTDSFAELTVGVIPSSADQVLVGTIDRTRHPDVRASFVLGFNEGLWPKMPETDVVLTDEDRQRLNWPDLSVKGSSNQHYLREQYFTYIAFTRPSEFLQVSFSRRNWSGTTLAPSRYFRRLATFCGPARVVTRAATDGHDLCNRETPIPITTPKLIRELLTAVRTDGFPATSSFWLDLARQLNRRPETQETFRTFVEGLCDRNGAEIGSETADKLFTHQVTLSQLESFFRCPFQHFCKYGLDLQVAPRFRLEPVDLGKFRHKVMEVVWRRIVAKGQTWFQTSDEEIARFVADAVSENAQAIRSNVFGSRARNRYILEGTQRELTMAATEQMRMLRSGRFTPTAFEQEFTHPVRTDGGTYDLVGRIDRVDESRTDSRPWIMILDYKSGLAAFKLPLWFSGVQLQLPGYLLVATSRSQAPAGSIFLPLVPQKPRSDGCFFPASGLISFSALDSLKNLETGEYPYCIKIKKDGSPAETGPVTVVADQVLAGILRRTGEMIEEGLKAIARGVIDIRPFYDGRASVCPLCDLRGVCRFDRSLNRYKIIVRADKDEILRQITGSSAPS